ncbi:MAG: hypothetical protein PVH32_03410, partial [Chromatiales bacterium]
MLNWDDPLTPKTADKQAEPAPAGTPAPKAPARQAAETAKNVINEQALSYETKAEQPHDTVDEIDHAALGQKPINPDDKRVINGMTDINQLAPFKYPWAWEYFLNAN